MSELRDYTLADIQKLPHLTAVGNKVYDLKKWAPLHPGGDDIRIFGGYDATVHYHMLHPFQIGKPLPAALESCCVGRFVSAADDTVAAAAVVEDSLSTCRNDGFQFETPFAKDLIHTVKGYFTARKLSPYATPAFYARLAFYVTVFIGSVLAFVRQPSLLLAIISGAFSAFIGLNVQHDANHGAMSRHQSVNSFWGSFADLIGQSRWLWIQQHIIHHHAYTNDHACDRDSTSAEPFLFFNPPLPAGMKSYGYGLGRKAYHAFQHLLLFAVLPFYYLLRFDFKAVWNISKYADTVKNPWTIETHRPLTMTLWSLHIGAFYIAPLFFHLSWTTLLLCHLRDVITSMILAMLFMLSHNAEPIKRYPTRNQCWYSMQVETSCTYGGRIAGALSGGLNYQIEHHLFPRVCSTHYPAISPLIRAVCARHNVSYAYFPTFVDNFMSTLRYMKKVGISGMETGL